MDQTVAIDLIDEKVTYNNLLHKKATVRTSTGVFAQLRGIARTEWFEAGRNGLKPELTFVIDALEYSGEKLIEWDSVLYGVYRVYEGRNGRVELYCEKKGGVS